MTKPYKYVNCLLIILLTSYLSGQQDILDKAAYSLDSMIAVESITPSGSEAKLAMANLLVKNERPLEAKALFTAALEDILADSPADTASQIAAYIGINLIAYKRGDLQTTVETLDKIGALIKDQPATTKKAGFYIQTGNVLAQLYRWDEAEYAYRKGIETAMKLDSNSNLGSAYLGLASMFGRTNEPDSFFQYIDLSEQAYLERGDFVHMVFLDIEKAYTYFTLDAPEKSLASLDRSYKLCQSADPPYSCRSYNVVRSSAFENLGNLDSARYYIEKHIVGAELRGDFIDQRNGHDRISRLYEKSGQPAKAIESLRASGAFQDSMYANQLEVAVGKERAKLNFAAEREAREKAELQTQLLRTRNQLYLAAGGGLLLLLLLGGYLFMKLRKARNELVDLNATRNKFFGIIAHDIRNPVMAMSSVGGQLRHYLNKEQPAKINRLADRMDQTTDRLSRLLDSLLDWARLQTGSIPHHPEKIDARRLLEDNQVLFSEAANLKSITIKVEAVAGLNIYADPRSADTIIRNLVSNAIKFSPEGEEILLSAMISDGGFARVSVIDHGQGISQADQASLFSTGTVTRTGTNGERGNGLGLLLCKELANLNGGQIFVESASGKGSIFRVDLPLAT